MDSQEVGQRLGGERPAEAAGGELGIHRQHDGPKVREVDGVERRERQPRWVEVECLGGHTRDQPRLQVDVERVLAPAPAPLDRCPGRHQRDCSGGGRPVPLHPLVQQVQFFRRPSKEDEPMVGQGRGKEFRGSAAR